MPAEPVWPPITEPELLARLALDDEAFHDHLAAIVGAFPARELTREALERGLRYPWERPGRSYVLRDGDVELLDDLGPDDRARTIAACTRDRHPLVAIGANAAPRALARKLAHFEDPVDRTALVLMGELHGLDVGPSSTVAVYGAMPATLFPSAGTAVRAAVQWLTPDQATQLTWSELSYRLGHLEDAAFTPDEAGADVHGLFGYVSRFGHHHVGGEPVALAAVPARGRTARAMTQRELLDHVAPLLLGPGADTEALVAALFADPAAAVARVREVLWRAGVPFPPERFTPLPAGGDDDG